MGNIVLLDDLTINKIAAGEVIERPASVVKEMLENSIDAGAKNITIEIKNGGISLIKITDDGCGIAQDDMEIAFERHATSKIRKAEDLEVVKTMGFRGEALASIAAIAKVEMISKKADSDVAYKIIVEGGKTVEFTEAARSVGTTIIVQNLFYNTPVRYKFLKKDYTEAGYIEDAVTRIALVNRDVAIKLISNGKTIIQTNGNGDLKTVIYSIYGKDIASEIIEVNYEYEGIKLSGAIGKPVIARGNRSNQLFFLNGRYIKDKNLSAAADQAYKGMIPVGRYGFIVLNLDIDPKLVDVNVHPAKLEVRFEEESKVFKAVYHAIKTSLAKSELVANVSKIEENGEKEIQKELSEEKEEKLYNEELNVSESHKKTGISGLFQKIIKEPEETQEELSNNHLEEIFKYRQGLKDNLYGTPENRSINKEKTNEDINVDTQVINDDEISKKVSLGNTVISSNTREIDVNNVNKLIDDYKKKLLNDNKNSENTQAVDLYNKDDIDNTQMVDINKQKTAEQNTVIVDKEKLNNLPEHTMVLENNINEIQNTSKINYDNNNINNNSEDNSIKKDDFSKIASKLFETKLDSDNTQAIETSKIREALKEERTSNEIKYEDNPEFDAMYKKTFGIDPFEVRQEKKQEELQKQKLNVANDFSYANENINMFDENNEVQKIPYKLIGIVFSTYIIVEIKNEMYIIDQHAAHERIMYEKVRANYYSDEEKDEQLLLLPDVISLTHKEMIIAKENVDMFKKAGFSFEEFGENTIKLTSVPSMCEDLNTKQLFLDILDEIDTVAVTAKQEKEDKFIATIACKSAVKGNMKLDEKEATNLMSKLLDLPNPFTCPHGRPTAIKMTKNDLERKFSRR